MILWVILGITALASVTGVVLAAANPEYAKAAAVLAKAKMRHNPPTTAFIGLMTLAVPALWVWYSVQVGDWRFAAIFCAPVLFRVLFKMANPKH